MSMVKRIRTLSDLILLELLTIGLAFFLFRGVTSICDGFMHLSKVKIMVDTLRSCGYFPRWNPYWYFGVPMWRIYSPLSYYIVSFLGWIFNLSILDTVMIWTYLVFSIATVSMYVLARELDMRRTGCIASSILLLTSGSLILYWGNGSYPNVTGVALSPLALALFLRTLKKRSFLSVLGAGLFFSLVVLTYVMDALILFLFMVVISATLLIDDPSLLYISRGVSAPPKYTLVLPRIIASILLIAAIFSSWWALPFFKTYLEAPAIPEASSGLRETGATSLFEQMLRILGISLNRYELPFSPGIGHVVLALIGCGFAASKRKVNLVVAPLCFIISFIFNLTPWLGVSTGFFFWWRFSLYFALFAALCGGIAADSLKDLCQRFVSMDIAKEQDKRLTDKIYSTSVIALVILASIYPILRSGDFIFYGYDLSTSPIPVDVGLLESFSELGERVGADGSPSYGLNLFTHIPQSGGGNVHYMYMVNEFAYIFWRYMFVERDYRRLKYFARNYNVRWFIDSEMPGLVKVDPKLPYEVENFNSSFAELIRPSNNLILFIGDENDYSQLFLSVAAYNPEEIILVHGGSTLEGYSITALMNFDTVYLAAFPHISSPEINHLLTEYVKSGGCLILDTGNIMYGDELEDIPNPIPVGKIVINKSSYLTLNPARHNITMSIDFTKFGTISPLTISYAISIKEGATTLLYDDGRPVLVYWDLGLGKVFWTGLRLPYLMMLNEWEMKNKGEELKRTSLLVNLLRYAAPSKPSKISVRFEQPCPEEIIVYVKNASLEDALWVKTTYCSGWTASIECETCTELRIFKAGPNMILVFPERSGDYVVTFYFDKTVDVKFGEFMSAIGTMALLTLGFYRAVSSLKKEP